MTREYCRSPINSVNEEDGKYKRPFRDKEIPFLIPNYKPREPMACEECKSYLGSKPEGNLCKRCKSLNHD